MAQPVKPVRPRHLARLRLRHILRQLVLLVLLVIAFFLANIVFLHPLPPSQNVVNSKISTLQIWTEFPTAMEIKQSYVVEVSLIPKTKDAFVSNITVEKTTAIATNPTPVGTPDATFQNAFGPGYEPFATATLYAGTFMVEPSTPQERSLSGLKVVWDWNVIPQEPGTQVISEEIMIVWQPINKTNGTPSPSVTEEIGNPQISVQVNSSFDWSPVLQFVLGGALLALVTWFGTQIWEQISERRKNKTDNKPTRTPNKKPVSVAKKKR